MSHIQEIEKYIKKHKEQACMIANSPDYNEINMARNVENPIVRGLVLQHIDSVRELSFLRSSHLKYLTNKRKELEGEIKKYDPNKTIYHRMFIDPSAVDGYNLAKQEEIDKLDKEIKEI